MDEGDEGDELMGDARVVHVRENERLVATRRREGLIQIERAYAAACEATEGEALSGFALYTMPQLLVILRESLAELDRLRLWRDAMHRDVRALSAKTVASYGRPEPVPLSED